MKTVVTDNLGDITGSIFVGRTKILMLVLLKRKGVEELYSPNIPKYYSQGTPNEKLTLSYFVVILSNSETLEVEMVSIMCMPNGQLHSHYGSRPCSWKESRKSSF